MWSFTLLLCSILISISLNILKGNLNKYFEPKGTFLSFLYIKTIRL